MEEKPKMTSNIGEPPIPPIERESGNRNVDQEVARSQDDRQEVMEEKPKMTSNNGEPPTERESGNRNVDQEVARSQDDRQEVMEVKPKITVNIGQPTIERESGNRSAEGFDVNSEIFVPRVLQHGNPADVVPVPVVETRKSEQKDWETRKMLLRKVRAEYRRKKKEKTRINNSTHVSDDPRQSFGIVDR